MQAQVKTFYIILSLGVFASLGAFACSEPEDDGLGYGQLATGGETTEDIDPGFMDGSGGAEDAGSGGSSSTGGTEATGGAVSGTGGTNEGEDECAKQLAEVEAAQEKAQECDPNGLDQCQGYMQGICFCYPATNDGESIAAREFTEAADAYVLACLDLCSACNESAAGVCVATDNGGRCR